MSTARLPPRHDNRPTQSDLRARRYAIRYPFAAAAEIFDFQSGTRLSGMTSDISLGGCFVLRTPGFEDWHTRRPYPYSQKPERAQGSGGFGTEIALAKRICVLGSSV